MQFLKNNIWTLCLVALFGLFAFTGDAAAQSSVMELGKTKALNVFTSVKTIIFIVGGFGLVCCKDDVAVVDGRNPANSALAPLRWFRCAGFAPAAMPPVVFVLSVLYVVSTLASLYSSYALSFDPLGVVI